MRAGSCSGARAPDLALRRERHSSCTSRDPCADGGGRGRVAQEGKEKKRKHKKEKKHKSKKDSSSSSSSSDGEKRNADIGPAMPPAQRKPGMRRARCACPRALPRVHGCACAADTWKHVSAHALFCPVQSLQTLGRPCRPQGSPVARTRGRGQTEILGPRVRPRGGSRTVAGTMGGRILGLQVSIFARRCLCAWCPVWPRLF